MKLLLASSGKLITKLLPTIVDKPIKQLKIGWITTASKGVEDLSYLDRHKNEMKKLGWDFEEIDIEGKTQNEFRKLFSDKDAIHVEGGNTFYLLKAIKKTGFDKILRELIDKDVVYVGTSAGSYVMCPTIEMATWKTDVRPRYGLDDLTGLNYVPFLIFAHYDSKYDDILSSAINNTRYPVRILTDNQAILIHDEKIELVGEGEEVKLK